MAVSVVTELQYRELPCGVGSTAANLFEKGDMLYWDATNSIVKAAANFTWTTSEVVTRSNFRQYYVGIAGEANKSDHLARLVKVCTDVIAAVTCTSSTGNVSADSTVSLVGPEKASGNTLESQKIQFVQDPAESIGSCVRLYSTAVTYPVVRLTSSFIAGMAPSNMNRVATIWVPTATAADKLTNMPAKNFFGGAAEVLTMSFHETTIVGTGSLVMNLEKGTDNLAALTATLTGAVVGRVTTISLAADTYRIFGPNDTISLEVSSGTTGAGTVYLVYRPLS